MNDALVELYRHKSWATLTLIEFCEGVGDEILDASTPGTYGTIRETLRHLVNSEEGYFARLTGKRLSEPLPEGPAPLDDLAARIRRLGPHWEELAQDAYIAVRKFTTSDGWRIPGAVVMAQAIHHADDHRTHVLSVLSARGVEGPDLDLWSFADATGEAQHVQVPSGE